MVKLIDKTKISTLDYLYMFFIIIYAAQASAFVRGLGDPLAAGNIVAVLFTIVMIYVHKVQFSKNYLISIFVLICYTALTFVRHSYFSGGFIPRWFIYLSIAYVVCQVYGERIFTVIESVLLTLFLISLIIFIFHLIFPNQVYSFVEKFSLPTFSQNSDYISYNCIFYTINGEEGRALGEYFLFRRNAGFAWEPGAYACFACLAIACRFIHNPDKLLGVPLLVYFAAIYTSQSTTGFFILAALLLAWVILNKKFLWLILLIPLAVYAFDLAFVSDKFMDEYVDVVSSDGNVFAVDQHGRLFGLLVSWYEFIKHPIIGIGGNQDAMDYYVFSGIGDLFVKFGLVLAIIYFVLLFKSEKCVRNAFNNYGGFYIVVVIILLMISYQMWEQPLFLSLVFMSVYGSTKSQKQIV